MKGVVLYESHSSNGGDGVVTPPYDGPPTPPLSIGSNLQVSKQESSPQHYLGPHHYSPQSMEQAGGPQGPGQLLYQTAGGYETHLDVGPYDPYHPPQMVPQQQMATVYRD